MISTRPAGVDEIHVYACPNYGSGEPCLWVGVASYGQYRPDVAAYFGHERFTYSGYALSVNSLTPGSYLLVVYARSTVTGTFNNVDWASIAVTEPDLANCTSANPNDWADDTDELQWCLDNLPIVYLAPGSPGYIIGEGEGEKLRFRRNNLVLTTSSSIGTKATILAHPNLTEPMLHVLDSPVGWEISYIVFDGNFPNRTSNGTCAGERGTNIVADSTSNFVIRHIESARARCGSGLVITGSDFEVYASDFYWNGRSADDPYAQWADGITVNRCTNGYVHDNQFAENTDVDMAIAVGPGCVYTHNHVSHYYRYGFAGINFAVGTNPSHAGGVLEDNDVHSGFDLLGYGIALGNHPWTARGGTPEGALTLSVGLVEGNLVDGAVVNLAIDGIADGVVVGNTLLNQQGSRAYPAGCQLGGTNYTAADFGSAQIPGGFVSRTYHNDSCQEP